MALLEAFVGGGAALLGGMMTNATNAKTAAAQMEFSGEQAQANRDWQERLSGTAHQREVADLRAAGLNPILSGTGGMGAATGGGAAGQGAGFAAVDAIGNAANTAMAARRNVAEVKNMEETNKNIEVDTDLKKSQQALNSTLYNRTLKETDLRAQELETQKHITNRAEAEASIFASNAKGAKIEGEIDETKYGEIMRFIDRALQSIGVGSSAKRNLLSR